MGRINLFENLFEVTGAAAQQFPPYGDLDTLRERMGGRRDGKLVVSKRYASAAKRFAGFAYRRIFPVQKVLDWLERNPDFTLTWERFELARLERCEKHGQNESRMKKPTIERETVTEAVYAAIADLEDGTDAQLIAYASKRRGKKITPAQFRRAIKACSKLG